MPESELVWPALIFSFAVPLVVMLVSVLFAQEERRATVARQTMEVRIDFFIAW